MTPRERSLGQPSRPPQSTPRLVRRDTRRHALSPRSRHRIRIDRVPDDAPGPKPQFTQDELENSIPFDAYRTLIGDGGTGLSDDILTLVMEREKRSRKRTATAQKRLKDTADAWIANLAVVALNRQDPARFIATSFNNNDHAGTPVTAALLALIRDALLAHGLVEGQKGFRRADTVMEDFTFSRLSRYRPTAKLIELLEDWQINRRSIGFHPDRPLWRLNAPVAGAGPAPADVIASCDVLARNNALIAKAEVLLPEESWARLPAKARSKIAPADAGTEVENGEEIEAKWYAGDETATKLYRAFKRTWDEGGRIYGGWWMQLPKAERQRLTINGEPVVELDFAQLHPTLLYARSGATLSGDPYLPPEYEQAPRKVRELGKVTFNRFINTRSPRRDGLVLSERRQDGQMLPPGVTFDDYQSNLRRHLQPIAHMFGSGIGVTLQREDSDLAIAILDRLSSAGIATLPIHDSFIVQRAHRQTLKSAMGDAFESTYGFSPTIR